MDGEKKGNMEGENGSAKGGKEAQAADGQHDAVLKKCLEENKGEKSKCKSQVEAFKSSFDTPIKLSTPLRLRSGSLSDV